MRVLVTGATGFLGRHLVPALERAGVEVVGLGSKRCNLLDRNNLLPWKDQNFDRIYHLAAWTKAGDFCLTHKGEQWITNQLINTNVLWFWREFHSRAPLVTMGTSCAYPPELPLTEDNYLVGEPDADLYTYAMTKRMLYEGCRALRHQFGMSYSYLIPSTLYGPKFDVGDSHFIFDLIKKIWAGKNRGEKVSLWGDGSQVRELVYVEDAVRLIDWAVRDRPNELVNLASGIGYSIREYAEILCDIIGYPADRIEYDTSKFSGVRRKVLDNGKVREAGGVELTEIRRGLETTVRYYADLVRG